MQYSTCNVISFVKVYFCEYLLQYIWKWYVLQSGKWNTLYYFIDLSINLLSDTCNREWKITGRRELHSTISTIKYTLCANPKTDRIIVQLWRHYEPG
jgi:hypothetical protein